MAWPCQAGRLPAAFRSGWDDRLSPRSQNPDLGDSFLWLESGGRGGVAFQLGQALGEQRLQLDQRG